MTSTSFQLSRALLLAVLAVLAAVAVGGACINVNTDGDAGVVDSGVIDGEGEGEGEAVGEGEGEAVGEGEGEGEGEALQPDGSVGRGETCLDDRECNAGLTCDGSIAQCVRISCNDDTQCATFVGFRCFFDVCLPEALCTRADQCPDSFTCRVVPGGDANLCSECVDDTECPTGFVCGLSDGTATCVAPAARHQICSAPDVEITCADDLACVEDCVPCTIEQFSCSVNCANDTECLANETCEGGVCRR